TRNVARYIREPWWGNPLGFHTESLKIPLRLYLTENPTETWWQQTEEYMADTVIKDIVENETSGPRYENTALSDRELQIKSLEWLEPVIDKRFPQAVLEYLRNEPD